MARQSVGERVKQARLARGMAQGELARQAEISRQAMGAIESGLYQPGVAVAIRIARALGRSVESLFGGEESERLTATLAPAMPEHPHSGGIPVALARVGRRLVAVPQPAAGFALTPAAGIARSAGRGRVEVESFRSAGEIAATVLVAGCDPAAFILAQWLSRQRAPAELVAIPCSSAKALDALRRGCVHACGVHIRDRDSGEYNVEPVRRALGRLPVKLVNFARWELGLAAAPDNPLGLRGVADLARAGVRLVNRERGAGARLALDEALAEAGVEGHRIAGYEHELGGHLEVAAAVASGQADAGATLRVAAQAYGLSFIPLREERYDLVIPERELGSEPVGAVLDSLNSGGFRRELASLCAYDTSRTGEMIPEPSPRC